MTDKKKTTPEPRPVVPYPGKRIENDPNVVPEPPDDPEEALEILPDEDPFESPKEDEPVPGERP